MYTLNHDNIVKIFNHFEEEIYIYLVIEFAEGVNSYLLFFMNNFAKKGSIILKFI